MKCYTVSGSSEVKNIKINAAPYPHIAIGDGGNKRATWIPLGKHDASTIVGEDDGYEVITNVGLIGLRDKETNEPDGRYLVVAPRNRDDERALVLWQVSSGYRGGAHIESPDGVRVVSYDHAWHSGRGSLGETAEMLAVLAPGDTLTAEITGRRVQENRARLTWTGSEFEVLFYPADADPDAQPEGDYI